MRHSYTDKNPSRRLNRGEGENLLNPLKTFCRDGIIRHTISERGLLMAKKQNDVRAYGAELGVGLKQGLQGLNTVCSPKKRKTAIFLILIPLLMFAVFFPVGLSTNNETLQYAGITGLFLLGLHQFYVGKIKAGLLYTITGGLFVIGAVINLLKLLITRTFRDANGFPLLY